MKITSSSRWQFLLLFIIIISLLAYPAAGCKTPPPTFPQPVPTSPQPVPTSPQPVPSIPQDPSTSMPHLVPFINDSWEYTVYFPQDWYRESNMHYYDRGILDFHAPEPLHASLSITVYDIEKVEIEADIELVAQQWIDNMEDLWGEIVLTDNTRLDGNWDWYYAFDGVLWDLNFHVTTYLKQTDKFLYTLKLQLVEDEFDDAYLSKLEQIPELFELHSG